MNIKDAYIHNGDAILKDIQLNGSKLQKLKAGKNADDTYLIWDDVVDLSPFGASGHNHDDRYYTESEIDTKLATKSDTGHTHTKSQITDFPISLPASGGNADRAKFLETFKSGSTTNTYGEQYPIWAQWSDATNVRLKCTNYTVWVDKATTATKATKDGNGNIITSTYLPLSGGTMSNTNKVTNLNADLLDGYHAGVTNGSVGIFVPWPNNTTMKNEGLMPSEYGTSEFGYPDDIYLQSICKWAIAHYTNLGDITLIGAIAPNSSGTCILHLYSSSGKDSSTLLPRYCSGTYTTLSGYIYNFGTSNYTWYYRPVSAGYASSAGSATTSTYASNVGSSGTAGTNYVTAANVISMYNWYNSITATDDASNTAIDKWNEIVSFLSRIADTSTLSGILAGYAAAGHDHDKTYLKLTGGNVTGQTTIRKDLTGNLSDWVSKQHLGPFEVGRATNSMCVAIGVTDDNYGYIQVKGCGISTPGNLVLLPGKGNLTVGNATNTVYHKGNLSIATLMGSTAIGDSDEPVYWNGSSFIKASAYPTKASWNYDDRYLKLGGGNLTGSLSIQTQDYEKGYATSQQLVINGPNYDENATLTPQAYPGIGFHMPNRTWANLIWNDNFTGMNGSFTGYVSFYGSGFKKDGSSDDYVLLGGGGHKALSDFSMSHNHPYLPLSGGWMDTGAQIYFKGLNQSTSVWGSIGYRAYSGNGNNVMHTVTSPNNTGALYITTNGYDSANDYGGLAIDNDGVTAFGAGDSGSVFRVINEDNVSDGAQFYVTKSSGAVVKRSLTASNFISNAATDTQPYACTSTTLNTNLNADLLDGLHETSFYRYRGNYGKSYTAASTDYTLGPGTYTTSESGYSGALLAFNSSGSASAIQFWTHYIQGNLYYRTSIDSNRWGKTNGEWTRILDSDSYNYYAPTLTGGGASGTWNISILGNADTLDNQHLITQVSDWDTDSLSIFKSSEHSSSNAPTTDFLYGLTLRFHRDASTYHTDLVSKLYSDALFFRRKTESGYGSWRELIHSGNISSQSVNYASSAGSVDWNNVSNKPTTISGYGITDALTTKSIIWKNDYERYVILLCKIGTNSTNISHTINGTFWTTRGGGSRYQAAYINVHCSDWSNGYNEYCVFTPFGLGVNCRLVTCTYQSSQYLAVTFENIQATNIYFDGSYDNILFTPVIYYIDNSNTVKNSEIYNSISEVIYKKLDIYEVPESTASYSLSNAAWTNTITLPTTAGSYILNIVSGNSTLTGVFSIGASDNAKDEISLHLHGNGPRLYARTNGTMLQLSSNDASATSHSVTIKYRRMI